MGTLRQRPSRREGCVRAPQVSHRQSIGTCMRLRRIDSCGVPLREDPFRAWRFEQAFIVLWLLRAAVGVCSRWCSSACRSRASRCFSASCHVLKLLLAVVSCVERRRLSACPGKHDRSCGDADECCSRLLLAVRKGPRSQALAAQAYPWHSELPRVPPPAARSSSAARSELAAGPNAVRFSTPAPAPSPTPLDTALITVPSFSPL